MTANAKTWDGLAEITAVRLFSPNHPTGHVTRAMTVTLRIDQPRDETINAFTALLGGTAVVKVGPDE